LAGELNIRVRIRNGIMERFETIVHDSGDRLISICKYAFLKICNIFLEYNNIYRYTRGKRLLEQKSIIDYMVIDILLLIILITIRQETVFIVQSINKD